MARTVDNEDERLRRIIMVGKYVAETGSSTRKTAKYFTENYFPISNYTVSDYCNRYKKLEPSLKDKIVSSMKEKVWQCNVSRSMIDKYMNEYLVGNIKTTKTGAELRIISIEKPTEDAVAVEKNLEDAFLFYFGEKSEEKQDA